MTARQKKKESGLLHRKSFDCSKLFAPDYFHMPPELDRFRDWFLPTADGERLDFAAFLFLGPQISRERNNKGVTIRILEGGKG
jgi:hypothetical protein